VLASVNSSNGWNNFNNFKSLASERYPHLRIDFLSNVNVREFFDPNKAIFVYSSYLDSLPRSILEAESAGMPSVIVDTTGCAEAVLPGRTALVVPPDSNVLADAIRLLMSSPALRCQIIEEAPAFVADNFSWENMANGYSQIIKLVGKTLL
jgi:glycosyltransferase involved in cell wall biosynthesis